MNPYQEFNESVQASYKKSLIKPLHDKTYKLTPFVVTFCKGDLTSIDIRNYLELGLKNIRFKLAHVLTRQAKIEMFQMLRDAVDWYCKKYEITKLPITTWIDIPNSLIRTGVLKKELEESVEIKDNSIVEVTAKPEMKNQCDSRIIYIDDPFTIKTVPVGTQIIVGFRIYMIVTEVIDALTLKCKILQGDKMKSEEFVCIRGIKHLRPMLSEGDMDVVKFAKEYKIDVIIIHTIRKPLMLEKIKQLYAGMEVPLVMSTICEQEGLDHAEEIIKASDGVILGRQFMACEILEPNKMSAIQLHLSAMCKKHGVPFFISGNILGRTLQTGSLSVLDVDDITNAVLHGTGFVLKNYKDPVITTRAMKFLDSICKTVEHITPEPNEYWRLIDEILLPTNAAEACYIGCALTAKMIDAAAVIVLSKTGRTPKFISRLLSQFPILTITTSPRVARSLQLYKGIIPIIYDQPAKQDWYDEMEERIKYAVFYGLKSDIFRYGSRYVTLRKTSPISAFPDSVSTWTVKIIKNKINRYI